MDTMRTSKKVLWESAWWLVRSCKGKVRPEDWLNRNGFRDLVILAKSVYLKGRYGYDENIHTGRG